MSVVGIDIGHSTAVVAIARRGGIDVLANEVSKRQTACMVAFQGKERKLGEAAASTITSNLKNTVTGLKAIIGKKFHSEDITIERELSAYEMVDVAGKVGVKVQYNDEELVLSPERAMSMILKTMTSIAEKDHGSTITDVVVSVPSYFTDAERHAMLDAANIAGLNCLRLMTDSTAAALSYGIYKTDLPADTPTNVVFLDVGAMDTTVTIVAFVKGKLTVLATACDRQLGGRDFDMLLAKHFAAEWKQKHGIDALTNKKAMYRLLVACEKQKKILSANSSAPIAIESFMDDIDVKGMMERDLFLEMCAPLLEKLQAVIEAAFAGCGLTLDDISSVELLGGSCRIPAVQQKLAVFFGRECKKTLNFDECVAKGCALQCAMLSPAFKVRDFSVNDVTLYPIALSWSSTSGTSAPVDSMEVDGEAAAEEVAPKPGASSTVVFSKFNSIPNTKILTFYRKENFTLTAAYDGSVQLPNGFPSKLGEFTVLDVAKLVSADADGKVEAAKIKVKLRLDIHGCLVLESAVAIEEQEVIEEVPPPPPPPAASAPAAQPAPAEAAEGDAAAEPPVANGAADPSADPSADEPPPPADAAGSAEAAPPASETPAPEPEKKKTKKVKRIVLKVDQTTAGITKHELMEAQESEAAMALLDRVIKETADAMNDLESFIYTMRDKMHTRYEKFASDQEKETISSMLTAMEDWLYDEGMDCEKSVYQAKLKELQDACAAIVTREVEAGSRDQSFSELNSAIERFSALADESNEDFAHIEKEEKDKVEAKVSEAKAFLADSQAKLNGLSSMEDPPVKTDEIDSVKRDLIAVCEPIISKPKPPPPKVDPAPAPAPSDAAADTPPAGEDTTNKSEDPPAEPVEAASAPDNMDVD